MTLAVAGSRGDSTMIVTDVSGFASGDVIGINLTGQVTQWVTVIGSPVGSVVTISSPLDDDALIFARVVRNRWRTESITVF